jgi:hypothetical protein
VWYVEREERRKKERLAKLTEDTVLFLYHMKWLPADTFFLIPFVPLFHSARRQGINFAEEGSGAALAGNEDFYRPSKTHLQGLIGYSQSPGAVCLIWTRRFFTDRVLLMGIACRKALFVIRYSLFVVRYSYHYISWG